jgi:hypothetical protein
VLFQRSSDADKMVKALTGMLGFTTVTLMEHRAWMTIAPGVEAYCYHSRQIDSAFAMRSGGQVVFNLNDCDVNEPDLVALRDDLGPVNLLLNQFSIAGFDGDETQLSAQAAGIIDTMVRDHRALGAAVTIPFASFVYFCCTDNAKINARANSPAQVANRFRAEGLDLAVLAIGQTHALGQTPANTAALGYWDTIYSRMDTLPLTAGPLVPFEQLETAFFGMRAKLKDMHGRLGLRLLPPVSISVPDIGRTLRMDFPRATLSDTDLPADLEINSQPLHFLLTHSFGLQTLGVSGRYKLIQNFKRWFRYRTLFAMLNTRIGLSVRKALRPSQLGFFWRRRGDLVGQLRYTISRIRVSKTS